MNKRVAVLSMAVPLVVFLLCLSATADMTVPKPKLPEAPEKEIEVKSPELPPAPPLVLSNEEAVPASKVNVNTLWGKLPFASDETYQGSKERGPGFSITVPEGWKTATGPHPIIGGTQHRYTSENGFASVVVVVFPMDEDEDLAAYLSEKQPLLLSSFKNLAARQMILGRRTGIGCHYQGILFMRDVACHLFLTRHRGKGYLVYGLYFNHDSGMMISRVMQSLRIF